MKISGGKALVKSLIQHDVKHIFCVPGESYLGALDGLFEQKGTIDVLNARHEAGAANMAESYGKLTGKPGIAFVTRGPGACHASVGVHISFQDSTPMILFVGNISRGVKDREAFQEIDFRAFFKPISKWVAEINDPKRIPEYINRAFNTATEGRSGPVVLIVPEDMLTETTEIKPRSFSPIFKNKFPEEGLKKIKEELNFAKKPLLILGGPNWSDKSCQNIQNFATNNYLPVTTSFRRQDLFNHKNENFVGSFGTSISPKLISRVRESDLILVIGSRLGEMTTQNYSIINPESKNKKIIHIHPDPNQLNSVFNPDLCFSSSSNDFSESVADIKWFENPIWKIWRNRLRNEFKEDIKPVEGIKKNNLGKIFSFVEKHLPEDVIVTLDAGNNAAWPQRFLNYGRPGRQIASTCGSMGYGIPAAVSSSILFPKRKVICCVGDGGFMMSGHEISTGIQYGASPIILLINNNSYGTIRMHQERDYPGREIATELKNPDFIQLSKSLGAKAIRVESVEEFSKVFPKFLASNKLTVIEIPISIKQLSHRVSLT